MLLCVVDELLHITAPEGLDPPQLLSLNESALRVIWTSPQKPNGQITAYNLYLDDVKIDTGMKYPGSYTFGNLQPFVIYMVQVCCLNCIQLKGQTIYLCPTQQPEYHPSLVHVE